MDALVAGQQHRQIPGRTRLRPEKAWAEAELSQTFAIVMIGWGQKGAVCCCPDCRVGRPEHLALERLALPLACQRA